MKEYKRNPINTVWECTACGDEFDTFNEFHRHSGECPERKGNDND